MLVLAAAILLIFSLAVPLAQRVAAVEDGSDTTVTGAGQGDAPDLVVLKSASVAEIGVNGFFDYVLTVRNDGAAQADGVVLIDNLDNELFVNSVDADQGSCAMDTAGNQLTCQIGSLAPGASAVVVINVTAGDDSCGPVDNKASASASNEPDASLGNNDSERVVVNVVCGSDEGVDVSIAKHVCPTTVQSQANFDALGSFAAKLLACPVVTLPGDVGPAGAWDAGNAGLVLNGESAFDFTLTDENGLVRSLVNGEASFIPAQLCEIELGDLDGDPGTNLCLETSAYQFQDVPSGETVIVELVSPDGHRWGTIEFIPQDLHPNTDALSLISVENGTVVLDTDLPNSQSDVMLHVFNFAELAASIPTPTPREGEEGGNPTPTPRGGQLGGNPTPRAGNLPNTAIDETSQVPMTVLSLMILLSALTAMAYFRLARER